MRVVYYQRTVIDLPMRGGELSMLKVKELLIIIDFVKTFDYLLQDII